MFEAGTGDLDSKYTWLESDFYTAQRKTDQPQLWVAGCSITNGVGVGVDQAYKTLLAKYFDLKYTDLSFDGSSILWQSDQIIRSDIRPNDIVIWGVTGQNRLSVIHEFKEHKKLLHLHSNLFEVSPHIKKQFPLELIDNSTLLYHNVLAIRRVHNFCKTARAKLVMLGLMANEINDCIFPYYKVLTFRQIIFDRPKNSYVDFGTDGIHPGPKQHKIFADRFIEFYHELYTEENMVANQ